MRVNFHQEYWHRAGANVRIRYLAGSSHSIPTKIAEAAIKAGAATSAEKPAEAADGKGA